MSELLLFTSTTSSHVDAVTCQWVVELGDGRASTVTSRHRCVEQHRDDNQPEQHADGDQQRAHCVCNAQRTSSDSLR